MTETDWAIKNLELAGYFDKDAPYGGMIGEAVKNLLLTHGEEGHSGMSHAICVELFYRVAKGEALTKEYWDLRKADMDKFAKENMGEPWRPEMIKEILGERPE
jgi:hypothetical protein